MAGWTKPEQRQLDDIKEDVIGRGQADGPAGNIAAEKMEKQRRRQGRASREELRGLQAERPLEHRTLEELQLLARQRKIPGRSRMNKAELIEALVGRGGG
jgi:Rho termination factor, N-terminal domain